MDIQIVSYENEYKDQLIHLFEDFQDYLVKLDPMQRLRKQSGYGEHTLTKTIQEIEENNGVFYVALDGDTIIGFSCGIVEKQSPEIFLGVIPSTQGRIIELYVDKKYRGKGIGTTLMKKVETYLKQKGCEVVKVEVFAPNDLAKNLYEKLGYEARDIDNIKKL